MKRAVLALPEAGKSETPGEWPRRFWENADGQDRQALAAYYPNPARQDQGGALGEGGQPIRFGWPPPDAAINFLAAARNPQPCARPICQAQPKEPR